MLVTRAHVLAIQDNEVEAALLQDVWGQDSEISLAAVASGTLALTALVTTDHPLPNLILLAGRFPISQMATLDVLVALKADPQLRCIPVVVIAGVESAKTIQLFYDHHAAAVIVFPPTREELKFTLAVRKTFWLSVARLPSETNVFYQKW